jgi:membrane protein DedA with SNARE-associated domain
MPFPAFLPLSAIAVVLYVTAFTLAGYLLGSQFPQIKDYLGFILPISIIVALIPVINQIRKQKRQTPERL